MVDFKFPWYILVGLYIYDSYLRVCRTFSQARKLLSYKLKGAYFNMPTTDDLLYHLNLSPTPRTFSQLPLLPFELRAQIWHFALPGPRVVEIRNHTGGFATLYQNKRRYLANSICRIPVLLHTCQQSREVALRHYSLSFGMGLLPPKIYVDFSKDIIYFGAKSDFNLAQGQRLLSRPGGRNWALRNLEKVKFLALRSTAFGSARNMKLEKFRDLKEVVCVAEQTFQLGNELCLRREEFGAVFRDNLVLSNHMLDLVMVFREKKDKEPEWKMPAIKKGHFVRGREDM